MSDGEFDGNRMQAEITENAWEYVCRTACNRLLCDEGDWFALNELHLEPGDCISMPDVGFTQDNYGPVLVIAWWRKGDKEPIYLVSDTWSHDTLI